MYTCSYFQLLIQTSGTIIDVPAVAADALRHCGSYIAHHDLSATGKSLPVAFLYWERMKSLICSSLNCSCALSFDCWPSLRRFSCTQSTAAM